MVNDQILDRLAKLIELQNRPGSVHEAEAAAARIQSLLTAHQLTMLDAERLLNGKSRDTDYATRSVTLSAHTTWRQMLLNGIAKQNFCRVIRQYEATGIHKTNNTGWRLGSTYTMVGSVENMATVVRLFDYLESTIDRLGREYSEKVTKLNRLAYLGQKAPRVNPKGAGIEFRNGAVVGVVTKLWAARNTVVEEANGGAIVLHEEHKLDEAVAAVGGETETKKLALNTDSASFTRGMAAGFGINTDPQLAGNGRTCGTLAVSEGS